MAIIAQPKKNDGLYVHCVSNILHATALVKQVLKCSLKDAHDLTHKHYKEGTIWIRNRDILQVNGAPGNETWMDPIYRLYEALKQDDGFDVVMPNTLKPDYIP